MKNALIGLLAILSILVSVLFGFQEKYEDLLKGEHAGLVDQAVRIQIPPCDPDSLYRELETLSTQMDCVFIREDIVELDGRSVTKRSVLGPDDYFERAAIELEQGTNPRKETEWIATYASGDPEQTGVVLDLFDDQPMRFDFLKPEQSGEGLYIVCSPIDDQPLILEQLAAFLHTTPEQLRQTNSWKQYDRGPVQIVLAGVAILVALFVLVCLFYPISRLQEIGVYKLLGLSPGAIWLRLLGSVFVWGGGIILLNGLLQKLFVPRITTTYWLKGLSCQIGLLGLCAALSTLSLVVVRRYTLSSILKGNHHGALPYWTSVGLKAAMVGALALLMPVIVTVAQTMGFQMQAAAAYEKAAGEMTIASYDFVDDEFQQMLNGNDVLKKKLDAFFQETEQTANAKYVLSMVYDAAYFEQLQRTVPDGFQPVVAMQVNENELALYASYFDKPVESYFQNDGLTVLVPDSMAGTEALDLALEAIGYPYEVTGADVELRMETYTAQSKPVFTQNMLLVEKGLAFVDDPVFVCLNDSVPDAFLGLGNQALSNPLRIDDTKANRQAIKTALSNAGLDANHVTFSSVYDAVFKASMRSVKTGALLMATAIGFLFFVDGLASYYLTLIALTVRKKEIFVKKILGYPLGARYRLERVIDLVVYGAGLVVVALGNPSPLGFGLYALFVLLDGLMTFGLTRRQEGKALAYLLKGEQ